MKIRFTFREVGVLIIAALVLGFVFGFDDGREVFDLSLWLSNFFTLSMLSLFALIIFVGAQKWVACRYGSAIELGIWKIRRFGFSDVMYLHKRGERGHKGSFLVWIPLGIILPLLIAFLSEGVVWFAVTTMILLSAKTSHRLGKQFVNLTEFEISKVAAAGSLACIILALLLTLSGSSSLLVVWLIKICIALAIANMLPIPLVAGGMAFFGSKFFYLFSFLFILFAAVLMWYVSIAFTIMFALLVAILLVAILLVAIAYHFSEVKG